MQASSEGIQLLLPARCQWSTWEFPCGGTGNESNPQGPMTCGNADNIEE